jgi:hypothetical protein
MRARLSLPATLLAAGLAAASADDVRAQSLRGSRASVDRMYRQARGERLPFHETGRAVRAAAASGRLVRLAPGASVELHRVSFPFVTAATRTFVRRLGAQYRARCGERLVVTSATRPATRQPANSSERSVHPTGMAVDLRKPAGGCLRWLRATLLDLEAGGAIEATEEYAPPHFHVAVFPTAYARYASAPASGRAAGRGSGRARTARGAATTSAARRSYRVRAGDTLWDIARAHDTTVARLKAANGLTRSAIKPGQSLVIPGAGR